MTLRLRRGTDLERQSVVFQEGELVYITDTKDLYAGDGVTLGGVKVSNIGFPSELSQSLDLNGYDISGNGTISATAFIGDGSGLTNLPSGGLVPGSTYDINITGDVIAQDNTLLVDSLNKIVYGTFVGDGSGITGINGVTAGEEYVISIQGNVRGFDSSIIVDSSQNRLNGTLQGSVLGFDDTILVDYAANLHYGSLQGDVIAQDNTLLVDSLNKIVYGTFVGDGSGITGINGVTAGEEYAISIQGNVRAFDSTLLIDATQHTFYGTAKGSVVGFDDTVLVDAASNTHYGFFSGDGSQLTNLASALTDPKYNISIQGNVYASDDSLIVDTISKTVYGTFIGDGSLLENVNLNLTSGQEYEISIQGSVRGFDSSIIVDPGTNSLYGTFVGDGSLLTDLTLNQLDDMSLISPQPGEVLAYDGFSWTNTTINFPEVPDPVVPGSNYNINIISDDSTIIIDSFTGTVTTPRISADYGNLFIDNNIPSSSVSVVISSNDGSSILTLKRASESDISSSSDFYGRIFFAREDINGLVNTSILLANKDGVYIGSEPDGNIAESNYTSLTSSGVGIGTFAPAEKLDVRGNITTTGFVQFGSLDATARNALTAVNGMVIYNSTANRFQGYQNGTWINLDDGTSA